MQMHQLDTDQHLAPSADPTTHTLEKPVLRMPSSVIVIASPRASDSNSTFDEYRRNPCHGPCWNSGWPMPTFAHTRQRQIASTPITSSAIKEICWICVDWVLRKRLCLSYESNILLFIFVLN
jgi:hypothetical protein